MLNRHRMLLTSNLDLRSAFRAIMNSGVYRVNAYIRIHIFSLQRIEPKTPPPLPPALGDNFLSASHSFSESTLLKLDNILWNVLLCLAISLKYLMIFEKRRENSNKRNKTYVSLVGTFCLQYACTFLVIYSSFCKKKKWSHQFVVWNENPFVINVIDAKKSLPILS